MVYVGSAVQVSSRMTAVAALHWWNAVRLATTLQHPWLSLQASSSSAFTRRAAISPYPILHRRQQRVVMETDDVTLLGGALSDQATPTSDPETVEMENNCDSIWKAVSPSFAHA